MQEWMLVVLVAVMVTLVVAMVWVVLRVTARPGEGVDLLGETLDRRFAEEQRRVDDLSRQVAELGGSLNRGVGAIEDRLGKFSAMFSDSRSRGAWGEVQLARVLDAAGLVEGRDYHTQWTVGQGRVDVAIPVGDRLIVIDAKFPVARLAEAAAAEGEERLALLRDAARVVESTARALGAKGYGLASGGNVIMFIPNEGLLAQVMDADPTLHERVLAHGVLAVGPAGLTGLIGAIGALLLEQRMVEQADAIVREAGDLTKRIGTWIGHLSKVGKALGQSVAAYNQAVGSWQGRVEPSGRRLLERLGDNGTELGLVHVEDEVRTIEVA